MKKPTCECLTIPAGYTVYGTANIELWEQRATSDRCYNGEVEELELNFCPQCGKPYVKVVESDH